MIDGLGIVIHQDIIAIGGHTDTAMMLVPCARSCLRWQIGKRERRRPLEGRYAQALPPLR